MRSLVLAALLAGCASRRVLVLENRVLEAENARLREQLAVVGAPANPQDFAATLNQDTLRAWLGRAGLRVLDEPAPGVLSAPIEGNNTEFRLTVQHFPEEKVLFLAATDYFRLEEALTTRSLVSVLTQLAALNYDLLLGKFQLNPETGEISLSVELNLDDGVGFRTFDVVIRHLIRTADESWPVLANAATGEGL